VYWVLNNDDRVPRPVRLSDLGVIFIGLIHNIMGSIEAFTSELYELSIYHSNQRTRTQQVWEEFSQDLETLKEDTDGA